LLRILSVGFVVFVAAAESHGAAWRFEAVPATEAERALRASVDHDAPTERVSLLTEVAAQHPGTASAGLARLAAGLLLMEEEQYQDALVQLTHADVQATTLLDHALLAVARAHDALEQPTPATRSYMGAAHEPLSAVACEALPRAAELFGAAKDLTNAAAALAETIERCPRETAAALLELGKVRRKQGELVAAAEALDRLDLEHPATDAAREAQPLLGTLMRHLPPLTDAQSAERRLHKGELLLEARRSGDALYVLRRVDLRALPGVEVDRARLALGRALLARRRRSEGRSVLSKVPADSPRGAEAAFLVARDRTRRDVTPYGAMADSFPGTPWAERALYGAANLYQKDAREDAALPWWRRLLDEYPDGLYAESAAWRTGWGEFRAKRFDRAAYTWERTARLRPPGSATPALLNWAARAHLARGRQERSRWLLEETVDRFKHSYHGYRASQQLARLGIRPPAVPPPNPSPEDRDGTPERPEDGPSEGEHTRLRELLLIDRFDEAAAELARMGDSPRARATLAWVEWSRGRYRPAIIAMKRAFPHWVSAAGDHLPREVWQILYPLRYEDELLKQAGDEGLDPSLVAALILQESSFDAEAVSRAGARGLMQIMPSTGRGIARAKRMRFRTSLLHDPTTSLDFGTYYLRQISDRFEGAVDKVLVGYNAGPTRAARWTRQWPGLPEEEFIATIPFTETRFYVRIVLANREEYRRLYGLGPTQAPANGGARP
jgi:soluble lytic murein transglycosylase